MFASFIGVALIYLFMLGFYRLPGLVAIIALTTYIYLTLVAFNFISGVLTLPGLAALVLGVGMAVDANIIMYEDWLCKLRIGRTIKQAFSKANKSSFLTIFDSNLTTVIAAAVLFFFGESSVKGFATMLLLGILMTSLQPCSYQDSYYHYLFHQIYSKINFGYLVLKRINDMILMKV